MSRRRTPTGPLPARTARPRHEISGRGPLERGSASWKLPRKRKKAFINKHGRGKYRLMRQLLSLEAPAILSINAPGGPAHEMSFDYGANGKIHLVQWNNIAEAIPRMKWHLLHALDFKQEFTEKGPWGKPITITLRIPGADDSIEP